MFSYSKGRNSKRSILKEYIGEIKALTDFQLEKCSVDPFSIGLEESLNLTSWWKNLADSIFGQVVKKTLSLFKLGKTLRVMPITRTTSQLYNDIVAFQDTYGI